MRKKIVWMVVSCLMVAALLLASCGPAVTEEEEEVVTEEEEEVVTEEEEEVVTEEEEEVVTAPEGPQYGGTFTLAFSSPILGFDEATTNPWSCITLNLTHDELTIGDWAKGYFGTGEAGWDTNEFFINYTTGLVAESWELLDEETVIWHIRKGVYYHEKPGTPGSGREVVAEDHVYSSTRNSQTPGSYLYIAYARSQVSCRQCDYIYDYYDGDPEGGIEPHTYFLAIPEDWTCPVCGAPRSEFGGKLEATDKWTVFQDTTPGEALNLRGTQFCRLVPKEAVEEYGDLSDWENNIGSGPFMLVDNVPYSSTTLVRNPNYWRKDPLNPENTLPYLDEIQILIISDASTSNSAFRTGKLDYRAVGWEDFEDLIKTNPELQYKRVLSTSSSQLYWRLDKPELPFDDIRVRRALAMAIDNQEIVDLLRGGNAHVLTHPIVPLPEFMPMYVPLEELSEETQKLYGYYPDEARQLLIDAGYPDGFTTKIVCTSGAADTLSVIIEYWAKIDVTLILDVKETTVYNSLATNRKYDEMLYAGVGNYNPVALNEFRIGHPANKSYVNDELCEQWYIDLKAVQLDWEALGEIYQELTPYVLGQVFSFELPTSYYFVMWQPWVKNYHGESSVGFHNSYNWLHYTWIDQDLKTSMGY